MSARAVDGADPNGPYLRRIRAVTREPGVVVAELEDDFHRFRVTLHHDGTRAQRFDGEALRFPWSTCAGAPEPLHALDGMALDARCTAVARVADPRFNCTHLFDIAGHAVAHAVRETPQRQYDVALQRTEAGHRATLARDGEPLFDWELTWFDGKRVMIDPEPPFDRAPFTGGFIKWTDEHLDAELGEAAVVLRRACDIGMGRGMAFDHLRTIEELGVPGDRQQIGICHTWQPERMPVAFRMKGTTMDFADDPDALLSDDA